MNNLIYQSLQRWARDMIRFVPIKSAFILSGNIHDVFPFPALDGDKIVYVPFPLESYLTETLKADGYSRFIAYDPIDGFVIRNNSDVDFFKKISGLNFEMKNQLGVCKASSSKAMDALVKFINVDSEYLAIFINFASRLSLNAESLNAEEQEFFTRALKLSYEAQPHLAGDDRRPKINPIFWLCEKINDLPSWLSIDNPRIRMLSIPKPDAEIRRHIIESIYPSFPGSDKIVDGMIRKKLMNTFVDQTDGMLVQDILAICQLSMREEVEFKDISEAVRRYKLGVTENPWNKIDQEKIKNGEGILEERVKGQKQALVKAMDIVKRAVTGLAGIQHAKYTSKPKGVLFLAGPTGVGKTELAKALTELIFGDENSYIRFDMSEFSQQHADQRLLGAPPGYVGYEAGGELTKAVKEKPFSVILFDEIEKAHPRILDKFLQILEDGRITDGRGETVYFSETIIIFTSNLGVHSVDLSGNKAENITPEMPYEEMKKNLLGAIEHYFKVDLGRPEILNRIGDNIVVFDFIRPNVAGQIFNKIWQNLISKLEEVNKIKIEIDPEAFDQLKRLCTEELVNGGRGIGNRFESYFINPLSRALFRLGVKGEKIIRISALDIKEGVPDIVCE